MHRDRLERALYDLTALRSARHAFKQDPDGTLAGYGLDADACAVVKNLDVRALDDAGVNPMLTWGLWLIYGEGGAPEYLSRLNTAAVSS